MEVKGTLKYRKVQRTPQTGENAGKKKWYATSVTDREVDFEGFVSHISDHGSPYSRGHHPRCADGCTRPSAGADSRRQERASL